MSGIKRVGVLTGGGDCPGLNAVIRAVTKSLITRYNIDVIGIEDGFEGLIENRTRPLHYDDVSGILQTGGTILGTSNKANPFKIRISGTVRRFVLTAPTRLSAMLTILNWTSWSASAATALWVSPKN